MEEMKKARVFIKVDEKSRIIRIEGEYSLPSDISDYILIDEGYGDRFNLAQTHYLDKGLLTNDGFYQYKFVNGTVMERSQQEIEADRQAAPIVPTQMEQLESQVFYTAVMTNTLLEE